jgi:oligopeptide/dipeptide ABC transporter ATP-binding protein
MQEPSYEETSKVTLLDSDISDLVYIRHLVKWFEIGSSFSFRGLFGGKKVEARRVHAVDDVSLNINRGETLGLVGESGSGKSTLGRCVLNLIQPTSGTILFDGENIQALKGKAARKLRSRMQVVFQDPYSSLDPSMRVGDVIAEPLVSKGGPSRLEVRESVEKMMEVVGLSQEYSNRFPHEFSGGQRQRIGIARALITSPQFVVFDEPTSALDASIQAQVLNLLKRLKRQYNLTSLFITHNMKVVSFMSDRIAVMYVGKIVEIGTSDEIIRDPLHPYTKMLISSIPKEHGEKKDGNDDSWAARSFGEIPSPIDPPSGCRFHPRCPYAMEKCSKKEPIHIRVSPSRTVACYLYGDRSDETNSQGSSIQ